MIIPIYEYKILPTIEQVEREYDIQISLRVTEKCNIACEYCLWHNGTRYETSDIIKIIDKVYEYFKLVNKEKALIYFHGGEPTTQPEIISILDYIRAKEQETGIKTYIEFQTNLVVNLPRLKEILERIDGLNISLHLKELMKTNTLSTFEKNFDYLVSINYVILNLDIMLEYRIDNMFRYLRKVLKFLKYKNIQISEMVYAYIDFNENIARYNKQIELKEFALYEKLYKKYNQNEQQYRIDGQVYGTNELFLKKLNCKGMKCEAGKRHLVINGDGNVFVCNTNMTNYLNHRGGEVFTNLLTDPAALAKLKMIPKIGHTVCRWDECSSDFYFGKWF